MVVMNYHPNLAIHLSSRVGDSLFSLRSTPNSGCRSLAFLRMAGLHFLQIFLESSRIIVNALQVPKRGASNYLKANASTIDASSASHPTAINIPTSAIVNPILGAN